MIISDAILSSSHTENRHLDYTYLSDIGNLLDMSSDESVNIVSCFVSALIFSIKFGNQDLESFCFHELTGWASIEENKMPKYRKINGYIEHKSFLKRFFSQDSVVARCQILARESIGQVEAIRSAPSVGTLLYIYATLGRIPSEGLYRIFKEWTDVVTYHDIEQENVRVYTFDANYQDISKEVRADLNKRLRHLLPRNSFRRVDNQTLP